MTSKEIVKEELAPTPALIPEDLILTLGSEEDIKELTQASSFLPSIRVFDSQSKACKKGWVPNGDIAIALGNDKFLSLGKEVAVLNCGFRPRAAIFQGAAKPIDYFDPEVAAFKEVTKQAMAGKKGYNSGLEFLVYVASCKKFCAFYLGNKSGRYVAEDMKALAGNLALIRSQFVERPENSWYCAEIRPCSTPFELPPRKEIELARNLFVDSMKSKTDTTDEETGRER